MKVLLIEPRNCWIGLNIALGYITAALRKAGHDVKVLDLTNHRSWPVETMEKNIILDYQPDLIGISLFYISYYPVKEMIGRIRKYYSGPIVMGGPQLMIEKEDILKDIPELDYAVIGDGEATIVDLCNAIQGEMQYEDIPGLIYRKDGNIVRNIDREVPLNIDDLPFPDYEPFGIEKIQRYTIITSRGCPHRCTYCFRSTPKWRPRSPENIIEELKTAVEKYKIEEFVVVDDAFNINPPRIEKFCDLLDANNLKMPWSCSGVRADRMTEALAERMKRAGCHTINIGVETLQPDLYETLNRNMPLEKVLSCIEILKKYKFNTYGYFLLGLPGETKEKTWDTYKKAKNLGIGLPQFSLLLPFPGTKMYDIIYSLPGVRKLEDYKRISTIWTFEPQFSRMKVAFETPEYSAHDKIEMYNKIRTRHGDPRPPHHDSLFVFGLHALYWVFKYDFWHSPVTVFKLTKNFLIRFIRAKGKHLSMTVNTYREHYLKDMESLLSGRK
jgi:radical SAM superfamily enzyme YgiQ (UPF0313 family)